MVSYTYINLLKKTFQVELLYKNLKSFVEYSLYNLSKRLK